MYPQVPDDCGDLVPKVTRFFSTFNLRIPALHFLDPGFSHNGENWAGRCPTLGCSITAAIPDKACIPNHALKVPLIPGKNTNPPTPTVQPKPGQQGGALSEVFQPRVLCGESSFQPHC